MGNGEKIEGRWPTTDFGWSLGYLRIQIVDLGGLIQRLFQIFN
jgi:hypothetical protein